MSVGALLTCLVASAVLAACAPALVRVLRPAPATVLLSVAALTAAAGTGFVACVLAFQAAARLPMVAAVGGWDVHDLAAGPGPWAGAVAGGVVAILLVRAVRALAGQGLQLWRSAIVCRHMRHAAGLVITSDARSPHAVAGFPGRVVVGAPVLAALGPRHRQAMLAHEQAHLSGRHHLYLQVVEIAIAANPALWPVREAVRLGTERWADEHAAARVGDRRTVAAAIAATAPFARPAVSTTQLGGAAEGVTYRVRALLEPPQHRRLPAAVLAALLLLPVGAAGVTEHVTEGAFEHAHPHTAAVSLYTNPQAAPQVRRYRCA